MNQEGRNEHRLQALLREMKEDNKRHRQECQQMRQEYKEMQQEYKKRFEKNFLKFEESKRKFAQMQKKLDKNEEELQRGRQPFTTMIKAIKNWFSTLSSSSPSSSLTSIRPQHFGRYQESQNDLERPLLSKEEAEKSKTENKGQAQQKKIEYKEEEEVQTKMSSQYSINEQERLIN